MDSLSIRAFAKINLGLKVFPDRRLDGYHNIETIFQNISLFDELTFAPRNDDEINIWVVPDLNIVESENLVYKAAKLLQEQSIKEFGVDITLNKQIPIGAGLGGGSSDAAATLVALNDLFDMETNSTDLDQLAVVLGSDVNFFLAGGSANAQSRGESLTSLPNNSARKFVLLLTPSFALRTAEVYAEYDKSNSEVPLAFPSTFQNDLELAAHSLCPELENFARFFSESAVEAFGMTGSGSTYFGLCENLDVAEELAKKASDRLNCRTDVCQFSDSGYQFS
jgi:4-diphosphocytidyl-2-C-methyl-D-erythritol kinase